MAALNIPNSVTTTHRAALNAALALLQLNGQCRLVYVDSTHVRLDRFNGKSILINGALEEIPSAGVTLASTGLNATTLYYVYAYIYATTMVLEASTTVHTKSTSTGAEIKTGDATRALVGMVYCPSAATFADSVTQRFVASWFNRRQRGLVGAYTADRNATSTSGALINTEADISYLAWGDDTTCGFCGMVSQSAASGQLYFMLDGSIAGSPGAYTYGANKANYAWSQNLPHTEGKHTLQLYGKNASAATLTVDAWFRIHAALNI